MITIVHELVLSCDMHEFQRIANGRNAPKKQISFFEWSPTWRLFVSDMPSGSVYWIYILTFYLTYFRHLSGIYADILSGFLSGIYSTETWRSRLTSGCVHCDLELAVAIRGCQRRRKKEGERRRSQLWQDLDTLTVGKITIVVM